MKVFTDKRKVKKRYKKPRIIFIQREKPSVVAVSCQKVFGENEFCDGSPSTS
jgi:hypothetical protein